MTYPMSSLGMRPSAFDWYSRRYDLDDFTVKTGFYDTTVSMFCRRPIEEVLKLLPGPHSEMKKGRFASIPSYDKLPGFLNSSEKLADGSRSLVLVVFIGGVTFAEISALRFLSSQEGMAYDVIVGTTKIVNGKTLVESFFDKLGG